MAETQELNSEIEQAAQPEQTAEAPAAPQKPTPIWRNRDYMLLWSGQVISTLGSTASGIVVGPGMARNSRPARTVIVGLPCLDIRPCWHGAAQFQRAPVRCIYAEL